MIIRTILLLKKQNTGHKATLSLVVVETGWLALGCKRTNIVRFALFFLNSDGKEVH